LTDKISLSFQQALAEDATELAALRTAVADHPTQSGNNYALLFGREYSILQ